MKVYIVLNDGKGFDGGGPYDIFVDVFRTEEEANDLIDKWARYDQYEQGDFNIAERDI